MSNNTEAVSAISGSERFERSQELVSRVVAGQTILVPIRGRVGDLDSIFTLNGIATDVWSLLDGAKTVRELAETLHSEYEVDAETAFSDLVTFLQQMLEQGLVKRKAE